MTQVSGLSAGRAYFLKKAWSIVVVAGAVLNFFSSGKFLRAANTVTLVPKVQDANKAMDFRPISGGNTIYKCIAKILTRTCLPALIRQNQTAFVHGRKIGDNVLLTQEKFQGKRS
ncbi:uncharacterized protein [Populus alba]|uniref:uncharacterized protein n=1 Tax=Populus alba TaxID=43335 RepID=UPI003CC79C1C